MMLLHRLSSVEEYYYINMAATCTKWIRAFFSRSLVQFQSAIKHLCPASAAHKMERSPRPQWIICRTIRGNVCTYFWLDPVNVSKSHSHRSIYADHHQSMYPFCIYFFFHIHLSSPIRLESVGKSVRRFCAKKANKWIHTWYRCATATCAPFNCCWRQTDDFFFLSSCRAHAVREIIKFIFCVCHTRHSTNQSEYIYFSLWFVEYKIFSRFNRQKQRNFNPSHPRRPPISTSTSYLFHLYLLFHFFESLHSLNGNGRAHISTFPPPVVMRSEHGRA